MASQGKLFQRTERERQLLEEQLLKQQKNIQFDTKEYIVDVLVELFRTGEIFIPEYQREHVWPKRHQQRFIESVMLGLPIPIMFFAEKADGTAEVVDGSQRVRTLLDFLNDKLPLTNLEKLDLFDGETYSDLPVPQQRKFRNRALRTVVLSEHTEPHVLFDLFERINTGSLTVNASELRKGAYPGPFYDLVIRCAQASLFMRLCPISEKLRKRGEGEELVLRFFAYSDRYTKFVHSVGSFLDQYVVDMNKSKAFSEQDKTEDFFKMLEFVERYFPHGFRKTPKANSTPRVRFEAISVGVHLALKQKPSLTPPDVEKWLYSEDFKYHTTTHASNSGPKLRARVEYVRDRLLSE